MRRREIALAALACLVAGCSRETRVEAGARAQILHIGNGAEPKDLDPATQVSEIEYNIDTALFEGLVNISNDGQTILPGVAERWEISSDRRSYTFHLRSDARWSDGSPVTAEDFVYGFRRAFSPTLGGVNCSNGFAIAGSQAMNEGRGSQLGVQALDPGTLEVRLEYPAPYLLYVLAGAPFTPEPKAVIERHGDGFHPGNTWALPGRMVSNGAFFLKSWRPNRDVVVSKNPHYWGHNRVRLDEIHFYPTDDVDSEERTFRSGGLHVTYALPSSKIAEYRRRRDPRLHLIAELNTIYVVINVDAGPLRDVRLRRALALAIDRDAIVPKVSEGGLSPAHTLTRPGTGGYRPAPANDFDPVRARALLAAAGYPGGKGLPTLRLEWPNGPHARLAEALQEAWRQVLGIHVALDGKEQKTMFDEVHARNYQFGLMSYFYGINAPETILTIAESDSPWNDSNWKSPAFDHAYREACEAPNEAARQRAWDKMEALLREGAPYIPIGYRDRPFLVSPMVKGWRDNPLAIVDWREIYLEP